MTAAAFKAPPPLTLNHGYANEEGQSRGMAPPRYGCFEIVNKNKDGEIIAVLVAENAAELAIKGHDVKGYLSSHVRLMPDCTVLNATFDADVETLQIALFYGAKFKALEKCRVGSVHNNFEFMKERRNTRAPSAVVILHQFRQTLPTSAAFLRGRCIEYSVIEKMSC